MPPALQLYTVRNQLALDFPGTISRVREIGYRAVETYPFPGGISDAFAAETFRRNEITVVAMHGDLPEGPALTSTIKTAVALDCRKVIWHGWPRPAEFDSLNGLKALAARYNQASLELRNHDLDLGLHNHWWEFQPTEGRPPYRFFLETLDPAIFFEIDTYWVQTAGLNPSSIIQEFGPRAQFLHLKDGPAVQGAPMTALGEGNLDFKAILTAPVSPVQLVVELDECASDVFDAARRSLAFLQQFMKD